MANAAVQFAVKVAKERGHVDRADTQAVRSAGFSKARVVEIIAVMVENFFTNLLNIVADTDIDFPVVRAMNAT